MNAPTLFCLSVAFQVECAEVPARQSEAQIPLALLFRHSLRQHVVLVALVLIGALLLCTLASALHHCHSHDHANCTICSLAKAPLCTPEASPPEVSPVTWPELIVLPTARPTRQSLFMFAARAPPAQIM
jgi:hypothetical protein